MMTDEEIAQFLRLKQENEKLKACIREHEETGINRAFAKLEQLRYSIGFDGSTSIRAFNTIFDCLISLRDKIDG